MFLLFFTIFFINNALSANCPYLLPYKVGSEHRVLQGFNGKFSHLPPLQYGVDFEMGVGTEIYAAQNGIIKEVKFNSNLSGKTSKFIKHANFIKIIHTDKTMALYAHLKQNGVLVKKDQKVSAGEVIGQSGCTGFCDGAHLHFEVYKPASNKKGRQSLPFSFISKKGIEKKLRRQKSYQAVLNKNKSCDLF